MLICAVDVDLLTRWITAIDFADWPQQHRLADGQIRPSMVTDLGWYGFGSETEEIVRTMLSHFPGCQDYQRMLSVVMPGHSIAPHVDGQSKNWMCRVHVPLTSNDKSHFIVAGEPVHMAPGFAYRVDTTIEHAVTNEGDTPRIHFMFDVGRP
jgi:hypothetical protein